MKKSGFSKSQRVWYNLVEKSILKSIGKKWILKSQRVWYNLAEITILLVVISKTQWENLSEAKNHFYSPIFGQKQVKTSKKSSENV